MSPLAHLLLAALALHAACGATVPAPTPREPLREEQPAVLKDENELRAKPEDIPVEVLIEDSHPAIKNNEVADDDDEIKRPAVDLRNPGPPQRQEHETQSADQFPNAQEKLASLRDTIVQTQDLLRQGIQGIGDDISNWLATNQRMNQIQQNIQSLRDSFTLQIQKLHQAAKDLAAPQALKTEETLEEVQLQPGLNDVETKIKVLENNFNNGVRALSEGVNIVAILRAEDESAAAVAGAAPAPAQPVPAPSEPSASQPGQILSNFLSNFQNSMASSIKNMTEAFYNVPVVSNLQNFLNPTTTTLAPGVQADTPVGATQPSGSLWPNWQLPNIGNIFSGQAEAGQGQAPPAAPAPLAPVFENFQNAYQTLIGFFRPSQTPNNAPAAGNNAVPQTPVVAPQPGAPAALSDAAPAPAPAPAAAVAPAAPATTVGPIRQILNNNPVVQGIANTVQRIQTSINNPEKPRDTEKNDALQTKGHGGGSNRPNGSGSADDSSVGVKESVEPVRDVNSEEPKKPETEKINPEVVEKTE